MHHLNGLIGFAKVAWEEWNEFYDKCCEIAKCNPDTGSFWVHLSVQKVMIPSNDGDLFKALTKSTKKHKQKLNTH